MEQHYVWIFLMTVTYGNDIWHYEIPHDTFAVSMQINIFKFIMRFITFTDKKRRPLRCCDKFAYLQELFQTIYKHNAQYIYPSSLLAINKSLYLNFGKLGFKSITLARQKSAACSFAHSVFRLLVIHISYYCTLENQKKSLKIQNITSRDQINVQLLVTDFSTLTPYGINTKNFH